MELTLRIRNISKQTKMTLVCQKITHFISRMINFLSVFYWVMNLVCQNWYTLCCFCVTLIVCHQFGSYRSGMTHYISKTAHPFLSVFYDNYNHYLFIFIFNSNKSLCEKNLNVIYFIANSALKLQWKVIIYSY